ncbi:MAG: hypothetical protein MUC51_12705 [Anaerolineae bacterium]|nr:hypothetical protein [Anaerolineae bacterium]
MTLFRNRHLFLSDLVLLILAAYLSFVLRLDSPDPKEYRSAFVLFTALALLCIPLIMWRAGIYSRYWRYASVDELLLLAGSVTIGVVVTAALSLAIAFFVAGALHDHAAQRQSGSFATGAGADHGRGRCRRDDRARAQE